MVFLSGGLDSTTTFARMQVLAGAAIYAGPADRFDAPSLQKPAEFVRRCDDSKAKCMEREKKGADGNPLEHEWLWRQSGIDN